MWTIHFPDGETKKVSVYEPCQSRYSKIPELDMVFWIPTSVGCSFKWLQIVELSDDAIYVEEISSSEYKKLIEKSKNFIDFGFPYFYSQYIQGVIR